MKGVVTELRYGFTLADMDGIARSATVTAGYAASNFDDRYSEAWMAVAETLYAAEQAPTRRDLWYAGLDAVYMSIRDDRRHYGAPTDKRDAPLASAPGFLRFWDSYVVQPDFSGHLVELHALNQIWPQLGAAHQRALLALAAGGTLASAAEAMGLPLGSAQTRIDRARHRFRVLWHEHEKPSRLWRKTLAKLPDEVLKPCGTTAAYARHRRRSEAVDDACAEAWRVYGRAKKRERTQVARASGTSDGTS